MSHIGKWVVRAGEIALIPVRIETEMVYTIAMQNNQNLSLEELSRLGEKFYNDELKQTLEVEHWGQYVVIDVEEKRYKINADRLIAVQEAQREFGNKLFYITQVGKIQQTSNNYVSKKYAWNF